MKKFIIKIMIITLIATYIMSSVVIAQTTEEEQVIKAQEEAVNKLVALNLLKGYEDGSLRLETPIRRVEFSAVVSRMLGYEDNPMALEELPFKDVPVEHWGYDYVATAYSLNIVSGYPDNTFKLNNQITYAEAVTMIIRTLGYQDEVQGNQWPDNYMEVGQKLAITQNIDMPVNEPVTRGEIAVMVSNALGVTLK